jgi:proliferating cell nuclear antigen
MEITIEDAAKADVFTSVFQHIKLFTEQITLLCDKDQMRMQCMDNAHVAILELTLPASWFTTYNISNPDETIRVGFNSTFLHRILSSRDKNQRIHLVYSDENTDQWLIHLTCAEPQDEPASIKPYFDKHFELPLIDIEEDGMQIPDIEYTAELSMLSAQFAGIVTQLKMFGDTMEVKCSEERIALASTSQDQGKMFVEIGINDLSEFAIDEGADLSLSFSLTYLKHICAYSKISNSVSIKFSDSFPMRVAYGLGSDDASLVFHLAPKIED